MSCKKYYHILPRKCAFWCSDMDSSSKNNKSQKGPPQGTAKNPQDKAKEIADQAEDGINCAITAIEEAKNSQIAPQSVPADTDIVEIIDLTKKKKKKTHQKKARKNQA